MNHSSRTQLTALFVLATLALPLACSDNPAPKDDDNIVNRPDDGGEGGENSNGGEGGENSNGGEGGANTNGGEGGENSNGGNGGEGGENSNGGNGGANTNGGEGGENSNGGNSGEGGNGGSGGVINQPPPDRPDCSEEADDTQSSGDNADAPCWDLSACNGVSEEQFLEQCSTGCFEKFDNSDIENFTGTLPPL